MTDKLKPCPFCGSPAAFVALPVIRKHDVECGNFKCGVTAPGRDYFDTQEDASKAWNLRLAPSKTNAPPERKDQTDV